MVVFEECCLPVGLLLESPRTWSLSVKLLLRERGRSSLLMIVAEAVEVSVFLLDGKVGDRRHLA